MKDKIEVAKIDIKIGDKTISLKPEQAKELKKILNEMFEESHDKVIHEHRYWWNYPYYTIPYSPSPYPQWTITCGSAGIPTSDYCNASCLNDVTLCLNSVT